MSIFNFLKCKARWVLRGFQDAQHWNLQTDSPTSTRPGFRLQCQAAAIYGYDIGHIDHVHANTRVQRHAPHIAIADVSVG